MSSAAPSAGPVGPTSDGPGSDGPASRVARTILRPGDVINQAQWPTDRTVTSVHVIRIGGAGMSAVARLALDAGLAVSGSDSQDEIGRASCRARGMMYSRERTRTR